VSLPSFGVRKHVPVRLLMISILIGGVYTLLTLRREFFPETTPEQATITMPYPGATPAEIEESMARKVEDAVVELKEVEKVTTTINEGFGTIRVEFRDGIDIRKGVDEVEKSIDLLQDLPEDAEEIRVTEFEPNIPTIMVTLFGDADEDVLKRSIRRVADDLRTLPGMGSIVIGGVRNYELRVDVNAGALLEHGISLPQVADAISAWMRDMPGGSLRTNVGNTNVRTMGVAEHAEAVREIVVKATGGGQSLRVGDIAEVFDGFTDEQLALRYNGKPAVNLTVFKTGEQDAIKIAEMVRAYVAGRRGEPFPGGAVDHVMKAHKLQAWRLGHDTPDKLPVEIATHSDLARFIEGRLKLLTDNAFQGAALIFVIILVFMSARIAWLVVLGLTTAICGTLVLMNAFGITLNLLTMFGLLITLGMLEDDAIVVSENINARRLKGDPPLVAAIKGAEQVFWPVVCTVLTTIVAFVPLAFVKGSIGELLASLPWVVLCSLLVSLLETMMMMPSHMAHGMERRERRQPGPVSRALRRYEQWRDDRFIRPATNLYGRFVAFSTEHRYVVASIALAMMIISLGMIAGGRLPFVFLQESDAETIVAELRMPIGTSLARTDEIAKRIENAAVAQPEIISVSTVVGQRSDLESSALDAAATHVAQIFIELMEVERRQGGGGRESQDVVASIRNAIGPIPDAEEIRFSEISGGPGGPDISIELKAADASLIAPVVVEIRELLASFDGVIDISDDDYSAQRELQIRLKPGAAALGLTVADVARQVRGALFGLDAHTFSASREDIDVRVRLDPVSRRSMDAIENFWVIVPGPDGGRRIPLSEIAEVVEGNSYATIRRVNRERTVTVTADTAPGVSPEFIMAALAPKVDELMAGHPGVQVDYAGRQEDLRKAFSTLPLAFGAACILIYVIVAWLFSSYTQPLVVMVAIPFGIIGVVWGHILLDYELTFLSLIGFVALSGVVVNNSLILIEFYNEKRAAGMPIRPALVESGKERLRAIVLTSITTFFGLMPLVLETSFQAKFLIPMAISVSFGLLSSTALTLLVLPCLLVIFDDIHKTTHFLWHGRTRDDDVADRHAAPVELATD
jgi:hydrophobic/amphiphilic exporter-1 (mainly G- bacteria), HAE1 family